MLNHVVPVQCTASHGNLVGREGDFAGGCIGERTCQAVSTTRRSALPGGTSPTELLTRGFGSRRTEKNRGPDSTTEDPIQGRLPRLGPLEARHSRIQLLAGDWPRDRTTSSVATMARLPYRNGHSLSDRWTPTVEDGEPRVPLIAPLIASPAGHGRSVPHRAAWFQHPAPEEEGPPVDVAGLLQDGCSSIPRVCTPGRRPLTSSRRFAARIDATTSCSGRHHYALFGPFGIEGGGETG